MFFRHVLCSAYNYQLDVDLNSKTTHVSFVMLSVLQSIVAVSALIVFCPSLPIYNQDVNKENQASPALFVLISSLDVL